MSSLPLLWSRNAQSSISYNSRAINLPGHTPLSPTSNETSFVSSQISPLLPATQHHITPSFLTTGYLLSATYKVTPANTTKAQLFFHHLFVWTPFQLLQIDPTVRSTFSISSSLEYCISGTSSSSTYEALPIVLASLKPQHPQAQINIADVIGPTSHSNQQQQQQGKNNQSQIPSQNQQPLSQNQPPPPNTKSTFRLEDFIYNDSSILDILHTYSSIPIDNTSLNKLPKLFLICFHSSKRNVLQFAIPLVPVASNLSTQTSLSFLLPSDSKTLTCVQNQISSFLTRQTTTPSLIDSAQYHASLTRSSYMSSTLANRAFSAVFLRCLPFPVSLYFPCCISSQQLTQMMSSTSNQPSFLDSKAMIDALQTQLAVASPGQDEYSVSNNTTERSNIIAASAQIIQQFQNEQNDKQSVAKHLSDESTRTVQHLMAGKTDDVEGNDDESPHICWFQYKCLDLSTILMAFMDIFQPIVKQYREKQQQQQEQQNNQTPPSKDVSLRSVLVEVNSFLSSLDRAAQQQQQQQQKQSFDPNIITSPTLSPTTVHLNLSPCRYLIAKTSDERLAQSEDQSLSSYMQYLATYVKIQIESIIQQRGLLVQILQQQSTQQPTQRDDKHKHNSTKLSSTPTTSKERKMIQRLVHTYTQQLIWLRQILQRCHLFQFVRSALTFRFPIDLVSIAFHHLYRIILSLHHESISLVFDPAECRHISNVLAPLNWAIMSLSSSTTSSSSDTILSQSSQSQVSIEPLMTTSLVPSHLISFVSKAPSSGQLFYPATSILPTSTIHIADWVMHQLVRYRNTTVVSDVDVDADDDSNQSSWMSISDHVVQQLSHISRLAQRQIPHLQLSTDFKALYSNLQKILSPQQLSRELQLVPDPDQRITSPSGDTSAQSVSNTHVEWDTPFNTALGAALHHLKQTAYLEFPHMWMVQFVQVNLETTIMNDIQTYTQQSQQLNQLHQGHIAYLKQLQFFHSHRLFAQYSSFCSLENHDIDNHIVTHQSNSQIEDITPNETQQHPGTILQSMEPNTARILMANNNSRTKKTANALTHRNRLPGRKPTLTHDEEQADNGSLLSLANTPNFPLPEVLSVLPAAQDLSLVTTSASRMDSLNPFSMQSQQQQQQQQQQPLQQQQQQQPSQQPEQQIQGQSTHNNSSNSSSVAASMTTQNSPKTALETNILCLSSYIKSLERSNQITAQKNDRLEALLGTLLVLFCSSDADIMAFVQNAVGGVS